MAEVVFLTREQRRGAKTVIGPATGFAYTIIPSGTPVSEYDVDALLELVEAPCCGPGPFEGMIRSFGVTMPTVQQLKAVPSYLWEAMPPATKKTGSRVKKLYEKKIYEKPEEEEIVIDEEIPVVEDLVMLEDNEKVDEEVV